jgi:hypothetical protein
MGFLSDDKDEYLRELHPKDFKDLLWLPVLFVLDLYVQFKITPVNEYLARSLHLVMGGAAFIMSCNGLSILFNLDWIASPFGRRPLSVMTPFRSRVLGAVLIVIGILTCNPVACCGVTGCAAGNRA